MSMNYVATARAIDPHTALDLHETADIVYALSRAQSVERTPEPGHLKFVYGSSRNGYADHALRTLLSQAQLPTLNFLTGERCMYSAVDRVHGLADNFTILRTPPGLARVDAAFAAFFRWCEAHPQAVVDVSQRYGEDEVLEILRETGISDSPTVIGDEDGDDVAYLFAYLRGVRAVLQFAATHELAFLYTQYDHIGGTGMDEERENRVG